MLLNRRKLLTTMAMAGAAAALPAAVRAEQESIWDTFARNRVLRDADTGANTQNALSAIDTVEPILSFDTANNLQFAIQQYQMIVDNGGWDPMSREVYNLSLGKSTRGVVVLKKRLMWSADLEIARNPDELFDEKTDAGVRRFQARHGLQVSGTVDESTLYALAVPADYRLTQLHLNAMRVQSFAQDLGADRYVVVNIPAATIEAVNNGMVEQRHTAIVGRVERATPILDSKIHQINFNPYWNVPKSIIQRDLIKYMNEDPEYLTRYRIHIYNGGQELDPHSIDWTTDEAVQYQFRQEPGAENSMGHVKINFHNPYDVYLHDTPQKALFGENARFHSSGCVRVDGVDHLVAWLLQSNGGWDINAVTNAFESNERLDVDVAQPVPIHTTYISAWANRQGTVSFRDDVYSYDQAGKVSFEG